MNYDLFTDIVFEMIRPGIVCFQMNLLYFWIINICFKGIWGLFLNQNHPLTNTVI